MRPFLIITCEHGGNRVPPEYKAILRPYARLLSTHRGWDIGSLDLAKVLAEATGAPLYYSVTTRLLVDLNRSMGHPRLFSEITRNLDVSVRQAILEEHYRPYREDVEAAIQAAIDQSGRVVHLSIHTFTPVLNGKVRKTDIGLLYDPRRNGETAFCDRWAEGIRERDASLVVRRNYPYRGVSDGFVTHLRRRFPARRYIGVELEVNQRFTTHKGEESAILPGTLVESLIYASVRQ